MITWAEVVDYSGSPETVSEYVRPALDSVPSSLASRLGACVVILRPGLEPPQTVSRWKAGGGRIEVELAAGEAEPHDVALELLLCLGQAVWETLAPEETAAWLKLLDEEIRAKVEGEIDEDALEEKRRLFSSRTLARSSRRLLRYAGAAFAGTLAEYVHALWHDVGVRVGPEHLPPKWLRRRLELFERWFPPEGGRRLFPPEYSA
ncbi:MAG TPA: hypothetical protein PLA43_19470 [Bryobacteraceae bacterium]|nr:hypothetical protein [Bryobacteraceae bacterium]HOL70554.1 hypothetical protein [Bryobacteraceae bacterium]HOQ47764.1 hypothetical protein [Bryobacteraceae bacterium]HPQ14220.1 hypothetical protein [Bryobacteraceae bacterium]HPU74140.1 hypothetical protein [Bryobacteraceae bacterium]